MSCQEEITFDLPQRDSELVVEGAIENDFPPYIILTKNQGYFDPIDITTYNSLFVDDIDSIKIWYYNANGEIDPSTIRRLKQYVLADSLPPVYTVDDYAFENLLSDNPEPYEFSKEGRTYFLEIKWNGKLITSQTTIPYSTPLDCLWVEKNETAEKDWKCDVRAIYSDPADIQNNILVKSKRLVHYERDSITGFIKNNADLELSIVDVGADNLINGESFETYFPRPKDGDGFPFGAYNSDNYKKFYTNGDLDSVLLPHDIALIKFCQIDEASMKFWRALNRQAGTNGNPFAEPINLVSNINGGFGVFTGYGAVYYEVPIIKDITIEEKHTPRCIDIF
tara:strand:+ start:33 stop:1043 length:1011 start_codon:yes stop_codon:yes gene_type:complete